MRSDLNNRSGAGPVDASFGHISYNFKIPYELRRQEAASQEFKHIVIVDWVFGLLA